MLKIRDLVRILGIAVLLPVLGNAQEMHGYVHSNYAGITGSLINPATMLTSKLYLDINTLGLQVNVDNNTVYLAKDEYKFSRFLSGNPEFPKHTDEISGDQREYYDYYNSDLKQLYTQVRVMGPSAMFATGNQAFGLSTAYRVLASAQKVPFDVAKFAIEGLDYYPQQRINFINNVDFRVGSMAFAEISGSYSRILMRYNREFLAAGITVKGLFSTGGAYGYGDNVDYMIPNSDTIVAYNVNGSFGVSLPEIGRAHV